MNRTLSPAPTILSQFIHTYPRDISTIYAVIYQHTLWIWITMDPTISENVRPMDTKGLHKNIMG